MKVKSLSLCVGLAAPLILARLASSEFVGLEVEYRPNPYTSMTIDLYALFDGDPGDFLFAGASTPLYPLSIQVFDGVFYQHPMGNDLPPNPTAVSMIHSLAYDTFVSIGRLTSEDDVTGLTPLWPGFEPDRLEHDDMAWYVTPDDHQGIPDENNRVLLARLSANGGPDLAIGGVLIVAGFSADVPFQEYLEFEFQLESACAWDLDKNGFVGVTDLLTVVGDFGACEEQECLADFDDDGLVGMHDLETLIYNYGACPGS